jgi:hypothetical protein
MNPLQRGVMMKKRVLMLVLIFLGIPLVCHAINGGMPESIKAKMATLSGQVVNEAGVPLTGGVVSFFNTNQGVPPMIVRMHRIPDMVGRMRPDGTFKIKLLPSSYYIGAMIVTDKKRGPGPPQEGDTFYFIRDDKGNLREFTVEAKEEKDVGRIIGAKIDTFPMAKNLMSIEGRLVMEDDGTPFVGGVVLVKTDMRKPRPDFVSPRTGKDGSFKLNLPAGTPYYLVARERVVGRPVPGTYVGTYGSEAPISSGGSLPIGNVQPARPASGMPEVAGLELGPSDKPPETITGKAGDTITGIEIKMFKVPLPGAQREQLQGTLGFSEQLQKGETGEEKPAEPVKEKEMK